MIFYAAEPILCTSHVEILFVGRWITSLCDSSVLLTLVRLYLGQFVILRGLTRVHRKSTVDVWCVRWLHDFSSGSSNQSDIMHVIYGTIIAPRYI